MTGATAVTSSREDRKQRNPPPRPSSQAQAARRLLYRVQDRLRPHQRERVQKCGRVRVGPLVAVLRSLETGKAHLGGLCTCASVWACPVCSAIIRSRRAEEVRKAIEAHGVERTMMLSLTVRHGLGHELKTVRKGVAGSYRRFTRGAPWKRFCREYSLTGFIRGLDLTHGPVNGWHPHIHALLLFAAPLSELQMREARRWIADRWAACVARELGEEHRPDLEHGSDLRPCHNAEYLAKLGLELTSPGRSKRGKGDQRTPMQIAYDLADQQDPRDAELWRDYCEAMFRAKMLTWSVGLRQKLGLGEEATDEQLLEEHEPTAEVVLLIEGWEWDKLRDVPGGRARVLEAVECGTALKPPPRRAPEFPSVRMAPKRIDKAGSMRQLAHNDDARALSDTRRATRRN